MTKATLGRRLVLSLLWLELQEKKVKEGDHSVVRWRSLKFKRGGLEEKMGLPCSMILYLPFWVQFWVPHPISRDPQVLIFWKRVLGNPGSWVFQQLLSKQPLCYLVPTKPSFTILVGAAYFCRCPCGLHGLAKDGLCDYYSKIDNNKISLWLLLPPSQASQVMLCVSGKQTCFWLIYSVWCLLLDLPQTSLPLIEHPLATSIAPCQSKDMASTAPGKPSSVIYWDLFHRGVWRRE